MDSSDDNSVTLPGKVDLLTPSKVVSHQARIDARSKKLEICEEILLPWIENAINTSLEIDSSKAVIFHICSIQELIKMKQPHYRLEIDGILDILNKHYIGYSVKQVPCNKASKDSCCQKVDCRGHVEICL